MHIRLTPGSNHFGPRCHNYYNLCRALLLNTTCQIDICLDLCTLTYFVKSGNSLFLYFHYVPSYFTTGISTSYSAINTSSDPAHVTHKVTNVQTANNFKTNYTADIETNFSANFKANNKSYHQTDYETNHKANN